MQIPHPSQVDQTNSSQVSLICLRFAKQNGYYSAVLIIFPLISLAIADDHLTKNRMTSINSIFTRKAVQIPERDTVSLPLLHLLVHGLSLKFADCCCSTDVAEMSGSLRS